MRIAFEVLCIVVGARVVVVPLVLNFARGKGVITSILDIIIDVGVVVFIDLS